MNQTPRQRRKSKQQASILEAATHLIVTKGYDNLSLRDIAKHSDYSPAGLYKLFESKAAIVNAVHARQNELLLKQLATVQPDIPHRLHLVDLCIEYIRFSLENPAFLILINNLSSERRSSRQPIPSNSPYIVFYQAVNDWIKNENIKLNKKYNVEQVTYALWAQIHGMATLRLNQLKDFEADFESANRLSIEIYLHGLQQWN